MKKDSFNRWAYLAIAANSLTFVVGSNPRSLRAQTSTINQVPAVTRLNGRNYNVIGFDIVHSGPKTTAKVRMTDGSLGNEELVGNFKIEHGSNFFEMDLPEVYRTVEIHTSITISGKTTVKEVIVKPIRHWTVYLVEHTHTDVGYPGPQSEIMPEQLRYIDYALDYCRETDNYPSDARFRWTCETAWAIKEYLRTRPKTQVERLLKRIKEGRIEVTGLYLNMSDLYDESCLSDLLEVVKDFKNAGINVRTAMQDDVNGVPWCLVDYLSSAGIKYLDMGENGTHARKPFTFPTAFWWESPSGSKILAYRGKHYHFGNMLGILNPDPSKFKNSLLNYLSQLESKKYPFDKAMIQFSGYWIDDSPPTITACNLVREWNRKYEWPKLKLATISEFFESIKKHYSSELPTYRLAWPDWWTDGAGSCALETAYVRETHAAFIANQGLMSMAQLLGEEVKPGALRIMNSINRNLAFFDEHTFGAAESVSSPLSLNTGVQWDQKSAFAWTAVKKNGILREESLGLLRDVIPKSRFPTIAVFNTLNHKRSGLAGFFAYDSIMPPYRRITVLDASGNEVPIQLVRRGPGGNYWEIFARNVPAFGYATYRFIIGGRIAHAPAEHSFNGTLQNKFFKLTIDTTKGGIVTILDKYRNVELIDTSASWEAGQFIYERSSSRAPMWGPPEAAKNQPDFTRTSMTDVKVGKVIDGPVWKSVDITGQVNGCADSNGVTCQVRLYNFEKRIQFVYSMVKLQVFRPEAVYVAFPFESSDWQTAFEVQGGTVVPGVGQLPGSASDWDGVQNFARVKGSEGQIVFVSPEAPLMEFGAINTGKWQEVDHPEHPYIYSYVLNNYWGTNFRAAQEGGLRWTYDLTSSADTSISVATRFGWETRVHLAATLRPGGGAGTKLVSRSFLVFPYNHLLLVFARPAWDGKGVILCVRGTEGSPEVLNVSDLISAVPSWRVYRANSLEEALRRVTGGITFEPYQVKFLLLKR